MPQSVSELAAPRGDAAIQEMWGEAFARAGVKLNAAPAGNRPGRGGTIQTQWDRALVKAGLIKASF